MPNISKEEILEIVREVGRGAIWLFIGVVTYGLLVRWLGV